MADESQAFSPQARGLGNIGDNTPYRPRYSSSGHGSWYTFISTAEPGRRNASRDFSGQWNR